MELIIAKKEDRETLALILFRNGYTVKSVEKRDANNKKQTVVETIKE